MGARVFFDVDPATLRLPHERINGADPAKLQRQIARHGKSLDGMPSVLVYRSSDGELMLSDGVTGPRALPNSRRVQSSPPSRLVSCAIRSATCQL